MIDLPMHQFDRMRFRLIGLILLEIAAIFRDRARRSSPSVNMLDPNELDDDETTFHLTGPNEATSPDSYFQKAGKIMRRNDGDKHASPHASNSDHQEEEDQVPGVRLQMFEFSMTRHTTQKEPDRQKYERRSNIVEVVEGEPGCAESQRNGFI